MFCLGPPSCIKVHGVDPHGISGATDSNVVDQTTTQGHLSEVDWGAWCVEMEIWFIMILYWNDVNW